MPSRQRRERDGRGVGRDDRARLPHLLEPRVESRLASGRSTIASTIQSQSASRASPPRRGRRPDQPRRAPAHEGRRIGLLQPHPLGTALGRRRPARCRAAPPARRHSPPAPRCRRPSRRRRPRRPCGSVLRRVLRARGETGAFTHRLQHRGDALAAADALRRQARSARPRACSSAAALPVMRAPVAPSGWPSAMAPPSRFTLLSSRPSSPHAGEGLRGEGLVQLDHVEVARRRCPPRSSALREARTGPMPITSGAQPETAIDFDLRQRLQPVRLGVFRGAHQHRRRAIRQRRGGAGRHRALLPERRLQPGQALGGGVRRGCSRLRSTALPFGRRSGRSRRRACPLPAPRRPSGGCARRTPPGRGASPGAAAPRSPPSRPC